MGVLSDAPWRLMVADVLFFMAFGVSSVVVPLLIVSRERRRCPDDDGDPCGAVAARRIVVYGLCGGVPQALAGAWLGGVADARGPRVVLAGCCGGGAAALAVAAAAARYDLPFGALCASGALQGACGGSAALLAASFAYASRAAPGDDARAAAPAPRDGDGAGADGGYAALAPDDVAGPASATRTFSAAATRGFRAVAASLTASLVAAPAAGGWAADAYGDAPTLAAAAALAGLALVWVVAALPPTRRARPAAAAPGLSDAVAGLRSLVAPGGDARALAAAWALVSCNNVGVGAIAVQYLARRWSKAQVGAYVSLLGAAAAVGNLALEPLARRVARRSKRRDDRDVAVDLLLARLGCLASALLSLGFATVKTQRAMYALVPLAAPVAAAMPAHRALLVRAVPARDAGAALGALGAVEAAAGLAAPAGLGAAYAALAAADRPGDAFYATVATALAALAILLARPPRPGVEPDLAEAILA